MRKEIKIKLVAIAKDEAAYLPEWIFHHLHIGFDAIDIYVNNTSDNTWDIANKLKSLDNVSFIDADPIFRENLSYPQEGTYNVAYENNKNSEFDYLMFLDIDEFWVSRNPKIGVKDTLANLNYPDVLSLTWFLHYENEQFSSLFDKPITGVKNRWVKTIFSLKLNVKKIDVHNINAPNADYRLADGTKWKLEKYDKHAGHLTNEYHLNLKRDYFIVHRMFRSEMEYVSVLLRGNPGTRGKNNSQFKTNRNGFYSIDTKHEIIRFDAAVSKTRKKYYQAFLIKYNLAEELQSGRDFVLQRYKNICAVIEESGKVEFKTLKNILHNVKHPDVLAAHNHFQKRIINEVRFEALSTIRELAISIESVNVELANKLMLIALELKPDGKLIQHKLAEYSKLLMSNEQ